MIRFEKTEVTGWQAAIRGMRNPMNSWERSDSDYGCEEGKCDDCDNTGDFFDLLGCEYRNYVVGPNDHDLMMRLANGGPVHAKYRRMIAVYVDITAPLYWWKEFDTYKVGTVANSCSTMHKIHAKEFTLEDFSCEHLFNGEEVDIYSMNVLKMTIDSLNAARKKYLETKAKDYWWQMIQLLPSSYNQKRTVMLNYEVLANIYKSRKNHRLDEWAVHSSSIPDSTSQTLYSKDLPFGFCDWIKTLPYSELITGEHFLTHDEIMEKLDKWAKDAEREV